MKIGAVYPQTELGGDPEAVRRIAAAVESLGYDYLLAFDHVLGAAPDREPKLTGPYTDQDPFHDPLMMFAYLAGMTRRLEFMVGVLILPQRQTVLVARQAADLDLLSGGRLRMGVGIGWNPVEYQALGQDFSTRGRRLNEQVLLLRQLWAGPLTSFKGEFDHVDRAALNPRPTRKIPLWIGGTSEAAFLRAGRLGDGFVFVAGLERAREGWARIQYHLAQAGRSSDDFGRELLIGRNDSSAEKTIARIEKCREWGCTHVAVDTMGKGLGSIAAHIDYLAAVKHGIS